MTTELTLSSSPLVSRLLKPIEFISALLMTVIVVMLLVGVVSRYVFSLPIIWIDEVVSISFLWLAMLGSAIAMYRNEHLRLTLFLQMMPERLRGFVHAVALVTIVAFLLALVTPAIEYAQDEWFVTSPALGIPNSFRVSALAFGILAMLGVLVVYAAQTVSKLNLLGAAILVSAFAALCWVGSGWLTSLGLYNILFFLIILVALCLVAGVPIAFCFGAGALCYLAFSTTVPLMVVIGRMDEGMSSLILVSVPIFVLLGCVLDATGAMADTVPPSIVLIVLGSVAGVSIAGLFQSGVVIAGVLLMALVVLARWKARHEQLDNVKRSTIKMIWKALLIAGPALVLPFLIRSAVGGGVATATEVSTIAVLYAMLIGQVLYGGLGWRKVYAMLVETAALSGAILLILGTASAMAWAITQSGVVQSLSTFLTTLPGGIASFMLVTILVFLILGCLLEGLPAILILAPIMFPIAKKLGIHEIHYSMVVVTAMNIGLMMPPIGIGFYVACRIGDASPDDVMGAIWPYIVALLVGLIAIAAVPWFSTVAL
jgi:tripartite ATP-independent transporter DctM subunit